MAGFLRANQIGVFQGDTFDIDLAIKHSLIEGLEIAPLDSVDLRVAELDGTPKAVVHGALGPSEPGLENWKIRIPIELTGEQAVYMCVIVATRNISASNPYQTVDTIWPARVSKIGLLQIGPDSTTPPSGSDANFNGGSWFEDLQVDTSNWDKIGNEDWAGVCSFETILGTSENPSNFNQI